MSLNDTNSTAMAYCNPNYEIYPEARMIERYVTPILYIIGIPGNILSLIIWMQKRMRHSSGYYLAALALGDLAFLVLSIVLELHVAWQKGILEFPVLCEAYPVFYLATQYLSPLLVLGFTTERYISICHPFKREKYCTVKRAKIVIVCLVLLSFFFNAINGYFYTLKVSGNSTECTTRDEVTRGSFPLQSVYLAAEEILVFFLVPVTILILNILVIREMRRLSKVEQSQLGGSHQRPGATTVMLLAVSFYQIFTTLPISIVYFLYWYYDYCFSLPSLGHEKAAERARTYHLIQTIIKEYGITHYAFNIFIYVVTGKMFRQELKRLFLRPFAKLRASLPSDYTSLRTSIRGSTRSRTWVTTNGNGNQDREKSNGKSETLL